MSMTGIRKLASRALMAGALGLGALGSAQATLVVGVWDPVFDAVNFPNLGWRGKVQANVPSACLALGGPSDNTVLPCTAATIISASVEFYDTTASFPEPTLETLNFTAALPPIAGVGLQLLGGEPVALRTGISSPVTASVTSLAKFALTNVDYQLELDYTLSAPTVKLYWTGNPTACFEAGKAVCSGVNQVPARITYTIPEPAGLALAGSALLGLFWARRRRPD